MYTTIQQNMLSNFLYYTLPSCHWNMLPLIFSYLNCSNICYSQFNLSLWTKEQLWKAQPTSYAQGQPHSSWWSHKELPTPYCKSDFTPFTTTLILWWVQQSIKDWSSQLYIWTLFSTKQPDQFKDTCVYFNSVYSLWHLRARIRTNYTS